MASGGRCEGNAWVPRGGVSSGCRRGMDSRVRGGPSTWLNGGVSRGSMRGQLAGS